MCLLSLYIQLSHGLVSIAPSTEYRYIEYALPELNIKLALTLSLTLTIKF